MILCHRSDGVAAVARDDLEQHPMRSRLRSDAGGHRIDPSVNSAALSVQLRYERLILCSEPIALRVIVGGALLGGHVAALPWVLWRLQSGAFQQLASVDRE